MSQSKTFYQLEPWIYPSGKFKFLHRSDQEAIQQVITLIKLNSYGSLPKTTTLWKQSGESRELLQVYNTEEITKDFNNGEKDL